MSYKLTIRPPLLLMAVLFCIGINTDASPHLDEIEFLLTSVGTSSCIFLRNGKRHTAQKAEDHLRMKYEPRKKYAKNAEQFISRFATKSSFSGKPYLMQCEGEETINTSAWLQNKLNVYRNH